MSEYESYDDPSAGGEYHGDTGHEIDLGNDLGIDLDSIFTEPGGHEFGGHDLGGHEPDHGDDTGHEYDPSNGHEPGGVVGPGHDSDGGHSAYAADTGDTHAAQAGGHEDAAAAGAHGDGSDERAATTRTGTDSLSSN
jgi:hypothetical protein